ncbi:MAG: SDR family oxidoreductase [Candidatus Hodarchaeales archaeon]
MNPQRKKILITGASSGLGLSHAIYLTYKGYKVIGTSRRADTLENSELKAKYLLDHTKFKFTDKEKNSLKSDKLLAPKNIIENFDSIVERIDFISLDITKDQSVTKAMDEIMTQKEPVDVLINNSGIGYFGPIEEMSLDDIFYQFEVNFFGYIRMIQAILPSMKSQQNGLIINTASLAGVTCVPFQAPYSASKAAVLRLTESLRLELKPFNILVTSIVPGDINTHFDVGTIKLSKKTLNFKSNNIREMKQAIPVSHDSPYFPRAKKTWNIIIQNLIVSPPPIIVSKKVEKILTKRKPKVHYRVGNFIQTFVLSLAYRLLPENTFVNLVSSFYGL